MKIEGIASCDFSLPLRTPLKTAKAEYKIRKGYIVIASAKETEFSGIGELSPLEEFSRESLEEAKANFDAAAQLLTGQDIPLSFPDVVALLDSVEEEFPLLPSARWAFDMLLCDLAAELRSIPLCELLNAEARSQVPVNGILGGTLEGMLDQLCDKVGKGYPVYKIKIRPDRLDAQAEMIAALRAHLDQAIPLRLDCNQGLGLDSAVSFLNKVSRYGIEYVEEPLAAPTPEALLKLRESCGLPIALDESLEEEKLCREFLDASCFQVMVLKPMLLGGIAATLAMAQAAQQGGIKLVLTSTLESGVGIAAGVHTAAAVPGELLPCGFDTAGLFSEQLDELPLAVDEGAIAIPERPGLGVVLKQTGQFGRIANF